MPGSYLPRMDPIPDETDAVARAIVDAAVRVYRELGPGLLESVYETCLAYELTGRGHHVQRQLSVPVRYRELRIGVGFRLDLLVDDLVIVEVKAASDRNPVFEAQLLTYLKLSS